jgi:hypothetical protein
MFCMLFLYVLYAYVCVNNIFLLLCLCILIVMYVIFLCILYHCVVLCTVCVYMCTVLLPQVSTQLQLTNISCCIISVTKPGIRDFTWNKFQISEIHVRSLNNSDKTATLQHHWKLGVNGEHYSQWWTLETRYYSIPCYQERIIKG